MNILLMLLATFSLASNAKVPNLEPTDIDSVFTPKGFDSNDNVEIVVTGWLPNKCHTTPIITVSNNEYKKEINIQVVSTAYRDSSPFCPPNVVPFKSVIEIGKLDMGLHDVYINRNTRFNKNSSLFITKALSHSIDNDKYLSVDKVKYDINDRELKIKGYIRSDCFEVDKVNIISDKENTYSVLPIMKKTKDFCPMKMTPIVHKRHLSIGLEQNKVLLHIRSANGNSVNKIIDTGNKFSSTMF